jgi:hypothetical protein
MAQPYAVAGIEPPLEGLLDDQIAYLVMRCEGIRPADEWRWRHEARSRQARTGPETAAVSRRANTARP